ncbi:MAG: hypothetical protein ACRERE_12310 [Candidatus Entotheonellia bacterium]
MAYVTNCGMGSFKRLISDMKDASASFGLSIVLWGRRLRRQGASFAALMLGKTCREPQWAPGEVMACGGV